MIRRSAALSCRRLKGADTSDVIAECLSDIYNEYNLMSSTKIVGCVTDNGSNFVKAFREFGILFSDRDGDNDNEETAEDIDDDDILLDALSFVFEF